MEKAKGKRERGLSLFPCPFLLLLRQRLIERRQRLDDGRALLCGALRTVVGRRHHVPRGVLFERLAGENAAHLLGVEHLAREELLGDPKERRLVPLQHAAGALVLARYETLDLVIDANRRVFPVVLMLRDLAAEEN